jgi:hypothetical protein
MWPSSQEDCPLHVDWQGATQLGGWRFKSYERREGTLSHIICNMIYDYHHSCCLQSETEKLVGFELLSL